MTTNRATVMAGMGSSITKLGKLNHLSKMRWLTSGVAIEMAATPAAVNHRLPCAQRTAFSCKAPSLFMISQPAPSRQ